MPWFPVEHKSDLYFVFNKNDWMRDDAVKVRAEGEAPRGPASPCRRTATTPPPGGPPFPLSQLTTANADPSVQLDRAAAQLVTQRMLIRRERIYATKFMTTGLWGTSYVTGGRFHPWDDYGSDPEKDIDTAKNKVAKETGFVPNCLTVAYTVHQALKRHPLIVDRIKHSSDESVTADIIKRFFELDEYYVTKAAYATNAGRRRGRGAGLRGRPERAADLQGRHADGHVAHRGHRLRLVGAHRAQQHGRPHRPVL
jgi:hypothetical protein